MRKLGVELSNYDTRMILKKEKKICCIFFLLEQSCMEIGNNLKYFWNDFKIFLSILFYPRFFNRDFSFEISHSRDMFRDLSVEIYYLRLFIHDRDKTSAREKKMKKKL